MIYSLARNFLFKLDAEDAHDLTIDLMEKFPVISEIFPSYRRNNLKLKIGNNIWATPIGLAAGLDKNCRGYQFLSNLGFGAVEVGTVTPRAQAGNPRPRLFRYIEEESIRNCMGFNNEGGEFLKNQVRLAQRSIPLGVNIGKNKDTPDELAYEDYASLYQDFKELADYIVINVSSPNTPGLRSHQTRESLEKIFSALERKEGEVDLYLKISPDIDEDEIDSIIKVANDYKLTGIIATNTTIMQERGVGGISGKLLLNKARDIRKACLTKMKDYPNLEFIGVGGFSSYEDVMDYWCDGGKFLQVYSAFVFQGPKLLQDLNKAILKDMELKGFNCIEQLIEHYHHIN
ncbi:dihydroorotate dehydrogenase (fumarate) [Bacteriovorax sp. BAL6_X]|uniref:quinone-dependent dihydroorotate dehydrogenase n=1 Tax=Bacteriovorax sp. BAL6_X TaxID=1201290 RepID=UPI000385ABE0|nr:quinone-dependent dihydroorotate dehydrogenase [Bacteriovorax sp. BAL6_X]EPZ49272.1 dihydroorotate dehydrogenase (fumarate) [Bacteriovorax sp. BAL6_X]